MTDETPGLAERLSAVREGIADASRAAGRVPGEITLIVVTKFHPASLVRELHALGVRELGENRHQEAQAKAEELADLDLRWNFVGQLQSKKARQVRRYASSVHSVDRDALVDALASEEGAPLDVFLQINLTDDPGRGGTAPDDAPRLAERVLGTPGLTLRGVMAVAPLGEEPRAAFSRVRAVSERVRELSPEASALSMGMSGDYRDAILEGATHLRIGTAITGNRQPLV
ncbi:YggS family pyridoxal phosphate-dependent enzyme [Desertivibrio insolitus]|uniref:YggS family pyridoxal phosphate-dependent enzyme n=1 Tax=Herbiconiux sp. SYSU D00978 TaxID=2812562 RepID=UPI0027DE7880|nr:YggS family pyridoxal phosphate-dependent enzyme [Herbiconiux sp. SYSU D00978]